MNQAEFEAEVILVDYATAREHDLSSGAYRFDYEATQEPAAMPQVDVSFEVLLNQPEALLLASAPPLSAPPKKSPQKNP